MSTPKAHDGRSKSKQVQKDLAATYNEFKEFEGKRYTGAKIGRAQKWYYDQGEWKEKKMTPDRWEFTYAVTKRRAGKAPAVPPKSAPCSTLSALARGFSRGSSMMPGASRKRAEAC